jgi:hypothetical protein
MPEPRVDGVAVSLGDGSALLIGGYHDSAEGDWIYSAYSLRYWPGP